eukprot:7390239-Prymnesium_polylepis.1
MHDLTPRMDFSRPRRPHHMVRISLGVTPTRRSRSPWRSPRPSSWPPRPSWRRRTRWSRSPRSGGRAPPRRAGTPAARRTPAVC